MIHLLLHLLYWYIAIGATLYIIEQFCQQWQELTLLGTILFWPRLVWDYLMELGYWLMHGRRGR